MSGIFRFSMSRMFAVVAAICITLAWTRTVGEFDVYASQTACCLGIGLAGLAAFANKRHVLAIAIETASALAFGFVFCLAGVPVKFVPRDGSPAEDYYLVNAQYGIIIGWLLAVLFHRCGPLRRLLLRRCSRNPRHAGEIAERVQ